MRIAEYPSKETQPKVKLVVVVVVCGVWCMVWWCGRGRIQKLPFRDKQTNEDRIDPKLKLYFAHLVSRASVSVRVARKSPSPLPTPLCFVVKVIEKKKKEDASSRFGRKKNRTDDGVTFFGHGLLLLAH